MGISLRRGARVPDAVKQALALGRRERALSFAAEEAGGRPTGTTVVATTHGRAIRERTGDVELAVHLVEAQTRDVESGHHATGLGDDDSLTEDAGRQQGIRCQVPWSDVLLQGLSHAVVDESGIQGDVAREELRHPLSRRHPAAVPLACVLPWPQRGACVLREF